MLAVTINVVPGVAPGAVTLTVPLTPPALGRATVLRSDDPGKIIFADWLACGVVACVMGGLAPLPHPAIAVMKANDAKDRANVPACSWICKLPHMCEVCRRSRIGPP